MYSSAVVELDRLHRELYDTFYSILVVKTSETENMFKGKVDGYYLWMEDGNRRFIVYLEEQFWKIDPERYKNFYRSRRDRTTRWLGVRSKVLELLKKREAMRGRVMVLQLSMLE